MNEIKIEKLKKALIFYANLSLDFYGQFRAYLCFILALKMLISGHNTTQRYFTCFDLLDSMLLEHLKHVPYGSIIYIHSIKKVITTITSLKILLRAMILQINVDNIKNKYTGHIFSGIFFLLWITYHFTMKMGHII